MTHHTIVVGGGAIGMSLAWVLAQGGRRVTLLDRGNLGEGTSWAAVGILPPANFATATDPIDSLRGLSHQMFPAWTEKLLHETGIDPGFRRCGGWYLADTPGEHAAMIGMTDYWRELSIESEQVSASDLAHREPTLATWAQSSKQVSAWWTPDECQIRSPRYLAALAQACRQSGVEVATHCEVVDFRSGVAGAEVMTTERTLTSDDCVFCTGVWTGRVARRLRLASSLIPIRGQILLFKTDEPLLRSIVNVGHRYAVCREDGHTLIGSSEEEAGFDTRTTATVLDSLRRFAWTLLPELKQAREIRAWSGLRPMTFDGFPMLGRVPDTDNVYIAAGHFRSGIHLSPATATVMSELMSGRTPAIDLNAFRVGKQQSPSNELS